MPQIIWGIAVFISLLKGIADHGRQKESDYLDALQGLALFVGLLIWGGFFNSFGIPQIIYIVLASIVYSVSPLTNGRFNTSETNVFLVFVGIILQALLLWWGGFFGSI